VNRGGNNGLPCSSLQRKICQFLLLGMMVVWTCMWSYTYFLFFIIKVLNWSNIFYACVEQSCDFLFISQWKFLITTVNLAERCCSYILWPWLVEYPNIKWFLFFILLMWHITLNDFCMLWYPWISGINPTWSWCMVLSVCCWIWFASVSLWFLHLHSSGYWFIVFVWCLVLVSGYKADLLK
jgi:hypothetical protein